MTDIPATNVTEANPPERVSKATLYQFIERRSKLITGIAAFIGLTAFSSQLTSMPFGRA
jgi:hypothetical protein